MIQQLIPGKLNNASHSAAIVYLVDDDQSVLNMLQALVSMMDVQVQTFSSGYDFLASYQPRSTECLLCDIRMPDIDGMELQKRLKLMGSDIPTIFLTGFAEVSLAVEAMKQGALDFVEKPFSAHSLLAKIRTALQLSTSRHEKWQEQRAKTARLALLTPKEQKIIQLVIDGKSSKEIAEQLAISLRTVENHRTRIMGKLHVNSSVRLVSLFI